MTYNNDSELILVFWITDLLDSAVGTSPTAFLLNDPELTSKVRLKQFFQLKGLLVLLSDVVRLGDAAEVVRQVHQFLVADVD